MNGVQQRKGIEMNGIQHKKGQNIEKFPGCLGRMVNLFDLNSGVPGNRLLTDKPHRDGSSLSRSQSDVVRMPSPTFGDQIEDKVIVSELRTFSNKKGNVTPMKMLLAQEMSKDVESKCNPPNVVAKLMGLDALPRQQHNSSAQRCRFKGPSRHSSCHCEIPVESWEQDQSFPDKQMQCEASPYEVPNKYKDVYEIWQQSPRTTYSRDSSPQKGRYSDNANENKMALVRQKFMEAKHLVTDEKLRQSKEFQDALEVLSSNRELFLKFLEDPNSTFSQHLNNFRCSSLLPQTKRITVLRPSKMVDNEKFVGTGQKGDNQTKKPVQIGQVTGYGRNNTACSFPSPKVEDYPSQPTRIVVLKPSPGKNQDIIRTPASPSPPLPRILHGGDFYEEPEEDDARESKEVAKEITRHMRENLMGHRRDETLLSSVFSNGYTGDDSSCNRSENEYPVENLSDSEVMSPTSRHSWDYINRFASPYSSTPFSRVSCSPESSVCREAKKRLSERWAMMTSNGSSQEQRHGRRSSSTLGEMLALSDTKKLVRSEEEGSSKEQERRGSTSCVASNLYEEESTSDSPSFPSPKVEDYPSQPTRIVVLKPSPGKNQDIIRTPASPSPPLPRILHGGDFYEEPEEDDARESKEVAKEITRHMRENLMGHRRDETLLSSVFSNGYTGDDSSCNRSENEYPVENLSDSEVMSPTSRHSWDYINRFASPYSSTPFSRVSCSPESSVCREAKKRLSERWAMMTSNGSSQEQRHGRRSSSTLGEMLALSDTKKLVRSEEEGSSKEQERRGSTSCVASNLYEEESTSDSPKNILRSKSVPGSSTMYGVRLNNEISDPESSKEQVKELMKTKSMKSSLKGKVSSLFFSKNKKTNKEKYSGSQSTDESPSVTPGTPGSPIIHPRKISNDASQCVNDSYIQECLSPVVGGSASKTPLPDLIGIGQKLGMITTEGGLSVAKPLMPVHISENQEQPSPISVLEPPFEEDENMISESSGGTKPVHRGVGVPPRSNLIDKSPPIESIARTLSWDDSCSETATLLYSSKLSSVSPGAKEEEQDWFLFVQLLLSAAGLNGEVQLDSFFARWHSAESPLDPCLRDKYANLNDKEPLHEAKRRQWRSNRKLIFDCVNAALLEISGYGSDRCMKAMSFGRAQMIGKEGASPMLVDHVWAQMKEWFSGEVKCLGCDDGDSDSLVVERVLQKEVVGKGWIDQMKWEADNLGREIEWRLLEELVEEAVTDLTVRALTSPSTCLISYC
ncbi:hypothetical protein GOBAR_AA30485 [Gossypium barbadense]|uniref:DUF4378 domain-containing protein n=1 Tax=Gossypium barbadense TaxID=3634 RepID=A0A2P5WGH6_GOSBA|nr:hypothetical protein GOBAR_AA30485 [Gossypium barbadense]